MVNIDTNMQIKKKLSGKYEHLYPVYEKIRDEIVSLDNNTKFFLKTIYVRIDFENGEFAVLFWKGTGLDLALPLEVDNELLISSMEHSYKSHPSMIRLNKVEDVNDTVIEIIKCISRK